MAQASLRKKVLRLLFRAKGADRDNTYSEAVIALGWNKPIEPAQKEIEEMLEKASNSLVENIIQSLKEYQGEAQTKSPRLVAFQEYWKQQLTMRAVSASSEYLEAAYAVTDYSKVSMIAYGQPGDLDSRIGMYLHLAQHPREYDAEAGKVAGFTNADFNRHLKAALDDEHRRRILRLMVELTPHSAHTDVLDIRIQMRDYLKDNYVEGLNRLLEWAELKRKQTQFHNPNWMFRFLREMELLRMMLAKNSKELEEASARFDMWQSSIQIVRGLRFFRYGQLVS